MKYRERGVIGIDLAGPDSTRSSSAGTSTLPRSVRARARRRPGHDRSHRRDHPTPGAEACWPCSKAAAARIGHGIAAAAARRRWPSWSSRARS